MRHSIDLFGSEQIFSTYTLHNITHVDAMLKMLDWLIPDSTKAIMKPPEWLMIVLAIYLYDLGMVVTWQEYDSRQDNPEYCAWFEALDKTPNGRDYLARTTRMTADEKDRFFFQEFVRKEHAARIREWIVGRHSRSWSPQIQALTNSITKLLAPLPTRFREYLGVVCESHHKPNLDNRDLYPLFARVGTDPDETINVQYAALMLRTTDLLHVTKDRTPSVMYQTIKFSDPKSVDEWDKQHGTFAVGMVGRKLDDNDPDSAVILVDADFTDERPFFALQEYVSYSDQQLKESKHWSDQSQEHPNGEPYGFPWHTVRGDIRLEGVPPYPLRFELDRGRLLDLLVGHTIYNDATVAIRELLQNAIDAVRFEHYLAMRNPAAGDDLPTLAPVSVRWNPRTRLLSVTDRGIGMDRDVITRHLMRVGASYYTTAQFHSEYADFAPISRFGIGILTSFMISDDIEILTLMGGKGHRVRMTSVQSNYLLRELGPEDPRLDPLGSHGTTVSLRIRDTVDLTTRSIEDILRHWIILPACKVEYYEADKPPVRIGFDSAAEAVRLLLTKTKSEGDRDFEIIVKRRTSNATGLDEAVASAPELELAFAVRQSSIFPERGFVGWDIRQPPAICIEGIRVSGTLPGFQRAWRVAALVSVRGSRGFRTTVSRSDLEEDDNYRWAGEKIAEMLLEYVADEVGRISAKEGRPLSQASTASLLLAGRVSEAVRVNLRDSVESQVDVLPSLVVEEVVRSTESERAERRMISRREVRELAEFWTIESRLVDSLGTISRDLGRELSLNEFLVALAPEVTQLKFTPVIPDAHRFSDAFRRSHRPEVVRFSDRHQQTAIQWVQRTAGDNSESLLWREVCDDQLIDEIEVFIDQMRHGALRGGEVKHYELAVTGMHEAWIETSLLDGDKTDVEAVSSRMCTILRTGSELHDLWCKLREKTRKVMTDDRDPEHIVEFFSLIGAFTLAIRKSADFERTEALSLWMDIVLRIQARSDGNEDLPRELVKIVRRGVVFDATSLWRDWWKSRF